jgi:hypothetical protein
VPERWLGEESYEADKKTVHQPFSYGPRGKAFLWRWLCEDASGVDTGPPSTQETGLASSSALSLLSLPSALSVGIGTRGC